ncbi:unnamed protein product [Prunus armeniaca]
MVCSSKRSRQQLQGTSKAISMASKRSSDPDDPTVAPPLSSPEGIHLAACPCI